MLRDNTSKGLLVCVILCQHRSVAHGLSGSLALRLFVHLHKTWYCEACIIFIPSNRRVIEDAEACCCLSLDFAYRGLRGLSATSEHERTVIDLLGDNDADDQRTKR